MPLKVKIRYPGIDIEKSEEQLDRFMTKNVLFLLKTWLITTTQRVPVWSGASRATFLKLAFQAQVTLTINPKVKSRIQLGIQQSKGILIREEGILYGWRWEADLRYISIVDRHNQFLRHGERALERLQKNIKALPKPVVRTETGARNN